MQCKHRWMTMAWAIVAASATCFAGCSMGPADNAAQAKNEAKPSANKQNAPESKTADPAEMPAEADTAAGNDKSAKSKSDEPAPLATADADRPVETPEKPSSEPGAVQQATAHVAAPAAPQFGQVDPLALIMPAVAMTEQEAKTCLVKVGDTLPDMRLTKLDGGEQSLKDLYARRLTVVLFWKATQPYAVEELRDLQTQVADKFGEQQVGVVGIDVQDQPQIAQQTVAAGKVSYPNLLDTSGAAFAQVANSLVPRTYLVDGQGKILWFDMEYSRTTRRELNRAIRATLSMNE